MTDLAGPAAAPSHHTATETLNTISKGERSAEDVMRDVLQRIDASDPTIRAFCDLQAERAMDIAKAHDRVPDDQRGPLHGLPITIKEVFDVAGMRCSWGSVIHADRIPKKDAVAVRRLTDAGAIVVGTSVSTEYAISAAGPTRNPFDLDRTPGGSSSGPAAAVAVGMISAALGSQTVGSIVRPAIYCGVFGLKPTLGTIPGEGGMPLSPRLDHPGILARSAADLSLLFGVLSDQSRHVSAAIEQGDRERRLVESGTRALVVRDWPPDAMTKASESALTAAADMISKLGIEVEETSLPQEFGDVMDVLYTIMTRDMALAHGDDRDKASDQMSLHLCELIDRGRQIDDGQYFGAVETAQNWKHQMPTKLGANCVILSAATAGTAPRFEEGTGSNRPQALWSLLGLPVVAVPTGFDGGMPIGIQVGAGEFQEDLVLSVAEHFKALSPTAV